MRQLHSLSVLLLCMGVRSGPQQLLVQINHFHKVISSTMLGPCRAPTTHKIQTKEVDIEALKAIQTALIMRLASIILNRIRGGVSGVHLRITYAASALKVTLLACKEQTHQLRTMFRLRIAHRTIPHNVATCLIRITMIRERVMQRKHTSSSTCHREESAFHHRSHQHKYQPQTPTESNLITISHLVITNRATAWTSFKV